MNFTDDNKTPFSFGSFVTQEQRQQTPSPFFVSGTSVPMAGASDGEGTWSSLFSGVGQALALRLGGTQDTTPPQSMVVPASFGGDPDGGGLPSWLIVAGVLALAGGAYLMIVD